MIILNIRWNAWWWSTVAQFLDLQLAIPQVFAAEEHWEMLFTIGKARRRACYTRMFEGFDQRSQKRAPSNSPSSFNPGKRSVSSLIGLAGFAKFPPGNGMTAVDVNTDEICGGFLEPRLLIVRETRYFDCPTRKSNAGRCNRFLPFTFVRISHNQYTRS